MKENLNKQVLIKSEWNHQKMTEHVLPILDLMHSKISVKLSSVRKLKEMLSMISGFSNNNKSMLSAPLRERPVKIWGWRGSKSLYSYWQIILFFLVQELNSVGVRYPGHNDWIWHLFGAENSFKLHLLTDYEGKQFKLWFCKETYIKRFSYGELLLHSFPPFFPQNGCQKWKLFEYSANL